MLLLWLLCDLALGTFGRGGGRRCHSLASRGRIIDIVLQAGWGPDGHNSRAEFYAYGDIVVRDKAAFA
jgi:hypothetical protein